MKKKYEKNLSHTVFDGRGNLPIAVIFGGEGTEREISALSAAHIVAMLRGVGRGVLTVGIKKTGAWYIFEGSVGEIASGAWERSYRLTPTFPVRCGDESGFLCDGSVIPVLGAVPALHGELGEDGVIQGALRAAAIPYIGCDTTAGAVCMDKAYTKLICMQLGIPVVPWVLLVDKGKGQPCEGVAFSKASAKELAEKRLGYPMFIKPCRSGSSIGACVAEDGQSLTKALELCSRDFDGRVLIERCLSAPRELECAYFDGAVGEIFTHPAEISIGAGFYDYSQKYSSSSKAVLFSGAELSDKVASDIKKYSARLCSAIGVRHLARVDFFLEGGSLYFNEIDTFPGMTGGSLYPAMLERAGIDGSAFAERLVCLLGGRQV